MEIEQVTPWLGCCASEDEAGAVPALEAEADMPRKKRALAASMKLHCAFDIALDCRSSGAMNRVVARQRLLNAVDARQGAQKRALGTFA